MGPRVTSAETGLWVIPREDIASSEANKSPDIPVSLLVRNRVPAKIAWKS